MDMLEGMDAYVGVVEAFSKFELLQLYHMQREAMVEDVTIFMSVMFGFIAVAYFVGGKLSRNQAIAISVLYSAFALIDIQRIMGTMFAMTLTEELVIGRYAIENYLTPLVMVLSWIYSLWFLHQVRVEGSQSMDPRPETEVET